MTINASIVLDNKVYKSPSFSFSLRRPDFSNFFRNAGTRIDMFLRFLGEAFRVIFETLNPVSSFLPEKKTKKK